MVGQYGERSKEQMDFYQFTLDALHKSIERIKTDPTDGNLIKNEVANFSKILLNGRLVIYWNSNGHPMKHACNLFEAIVPNNIILNMIESVETYLPDAQHSLDVDREYAANANPFNNVMKQLNKKD